MGFQSKTWSLSDEVIAEIERRVQVMKAETGSGSPNRVLLNALSLSYRAAKGLTVSDSQVDLDAVASPDPTRGKVSIETHRRPLREKGDEKR